MNATSKTQLTSNSRLLFQSPMGLWPQNQSRCRPLSHCSLFAAQVLIGCRLNGVCKIKDNWNDLVYEQYGTIDAHCRHLGAGPMDWLLVLDGALPLPAARSSAQSARRRHHRPTLQLEQRFWIILSQFMHSFCCLFAFSRTFDHMGVIRDESVPPPRNISQNWINFWVSIHLHQI